MRVAVTGGSGRVGQVTVAGLSAAGHEVVVIDRAAPPAGGALGVGFVQAQTQDFDELRQACQGAESIVHLAGIPKPGGPPPHVVHNLNVVSSYNALCVAVELGLTRIVLASSVNAIGSTWSREPQFDYFPIDKNHRTRNEDPYSLSKWIGEQQADSVVRRNPGLSVASIRLHMFMRDRAEALAVNALQPPAATARGLWGYTTHRMWLDACLGALTARFIGHQVLHVVADQTVSDVPSVDLARAHYPGVEVRGAFRGNEGFFDCNDTAVLLNWSGKDL